MHSSDLVRMANQITDYFSAYPKPEAMDGIAKHIHAFWDPRMRNALKAYIDKGGEGLRPLFLEAMAVYFKGPKVPPAKLADPQKTPKTGAEPATSRGT